MEEKHCSVCGGKIVDGRCRECGMNYRKTEGRYYLNERRKKEKKPAADTDKIWDEVGKNKKELWNLGGMHAFGEKNTKDSRTKRNRDGSKKKSQMVVSMITAACMLIPGIINMVCDLKPEKTPEYPIMDESDGDFPDWDMEEVQEEGKAFETTLTAGVYLVGCHLPEGSYRVSCNDAEGNYLSVDDEANGIHMVWWMEDGIYDSGAYTTEDIRLYAGAIVEVDGAAELTFYTENGQTDRMTERYPNPLTRELEITAEPLTAGEDFESGIYDLVMQKGMGEVMAGYSETDQKQYILDSLNEDFCSQYKNMKFTDGMQIYKMDRGGDDFTVVLSPSKEIFEEQEREK